MVAEVRLALERTVTVGAPKVHIAIVLLELCVSLEWLPESTSPNLSEMRMEKRKWDTCEAEKVMLTFMQPEARQAGWSGLCK